MYRLFAAVLFLVTASFPAAAQSQAGSGDIEGSVRDSDNAPVPAAKITISDPARGYARSLSASRAGRYRATSLPPGRYDIRVEAPGFAAKSIDRVEVRVGDSLRLVTRLEPGSISTAVSVAAEAPVIDTERTQQASMIDSARLRNLPINRRNYLDFALLAPGVVETNDIVDGTDFRLPQAPQSGLSFGGSNGRGNTFAIDGIGGKTNDGGIRPGVSQEAVQEFQVNQDTFSAEFGSATGGAVNIVTKSGTNERHGSAFGFLRNRALDARNYFDPAKAEYTRTQYGATYAAPIRRDKTYLFASYEGMDRHETSFVPALWDREAFRSLTTSQQRLADYFDGVVALQPIASWIRGALIANNYPDTLRLFQTNTGSFPFAGLSNQALLRLDHNFSPKQSSFLRASISRETDQNAQLGALIGFNRGRTVGARDFTLAFSHIYIPSQGWVSETRGMFSTYRLTADPNDPYGPELNISGFGFFGREAYQPAAAWERQFQAQQTFTYSSGRHTVKFGAEFTPVRNRVVSDAFFGGRFDFGATVPLATVLDIVLHNPGYGASLASMLRGWGQPSLATDLMAPVSSLQAFNLGIPVLYQQGFGNANYTGWTKRFNYFLEDTIHVTRKFTVNAGVRYELESNPRPLNTNLHGIAPRLGFAWSPGASGKLVIRGGYGIYYSPVYAQLAYLAGNLSGSTQISVPLSGMPVSAANIYQGLAAQGILGNRVITRQDLAQFGLSPGPNSTGRVLYGISPDFENPYAHQAHFEIERAVGSFALSAGYTFYRGLHIARSRDWNLYYSGRTPDNQPAFGFYDPSVFQNNVLESSANSYYHALTVQVDKRFSRHVAFTAHYTFSRAIDDALDFNSDFEPQDQLNARAERALSSFNQTHRLVANGVFESPWRSGPGQPWKAKLFGDFVLSPILSANSWRPFNVLAGVDNLGDNHVDTHRPLDGGRNIGRGPDFVDFDLRLARRFPLGGDGTRNLEATAEAFNLFNRTNFRSVNNTVGNVPLSALPNPIMGFRGAPTTPLAFTSAFDPRQLQLGLRFSF